MGQAASKPGPRIIKTKTPRRSPNRPHVRFQPCTTDQVQTRARSPRPHRRRRPRRRRWRMASTSTSGGGARPWRTALLTLRDESLASPSPTALLALLRRVLLSPASLSLAASAAALSPHEVRLLISYGPAPLQLSAISLALVSRLCRWARMWRFSRRRPRRWPLAPTPTTRCAASATW
jgi:hypothetical protein